MPDSAAAMHKTETGEQTYLRTVDIIDCVTDRIESNGVGSTSVDAGIQTVALTREIAGIRVYTIYNGAVY